MAEPSSSIRFLRLRRLGNTLRAQLATVDAVTGVQGWIIGNNAGEALVSSMSGAMDQRTLDVVGRHVSQFSTDAFKDELASEMEVVFGGGNLIARAVGAGWLMVIAQPPVDLAMVRVTMSVTAAALQNDSGFQNDLRANALPTDR